MNNVNSRAGAELIHCEDSRNEGDPRAPSNGHVCSNGVEPDMYTEGPGSTEGPRMKRADRKRRAQPAGHDKSTNGDSRQEHSAESHMKKKTTEKILMPLPTRSWNSLCKQWNAIPHGNDDKKEVDSEGSGLGTVELNGIKVEEGENGASSPRPQRMPRGRRTSRARRSAVFMNGAGGGTNVDIGLFPVGESVHEARKREITRSRWVKAIWYATEEAQRRRTEHKRLVAASQKIVRSGSRNETKRGGNPNGKDYRKSSLPIQRTSFSVSMDLERALHRGVMHKMVRSLHSLSVHAFHAFPFLVYAALLYVLYFVDIFIIVTDKATPTENIVVYAIMVACFIIFIGDLVQRFFVSPAFRWSIPMWLEVILVLSSIPDIIFLSIVLVGPDKTVRDLIFAFRLWRLVENSIYAGTRASRTVRVIHLVDRLTRFNSLSLRPLKRKNAVQDDHGRKGQEDEEDRTSNVEANGQTSIGRILEQSVSTHHMVLVGLMLITGWGSQSMMACDTVAQAQSDLQFLINAQRFCNSSGDCGELSASFVEKAVADGKDLLFLKLNGLKVFGEEDAKNDYREYPYMEVIVASNSEHNSAMHIVNRQQVVRDCWAHIMEASVLILFLLLITTSLSSIIRHQIIIPLQRIVTTVLALEVDPLRPLHHKRNKNAAVGAHEVTLIENALHKIAALMQLGFGEAGANIIQENMRLGEALQVNSEVSGKVVHAIYGFCDIRNFTDCTEVLQGDVVKLVNEVALIVHEGVVDNLGAPNKNIGDAFLLVWKPKGSHTITEVAESALRSYVRIIIEISRCKKLERWAKKREIQARLPGFRLKMGFGMHYGWAIEGAIGSLHKIDASYLSPHVNMASRLESATKQFGVYILFSEDVYALLSPATQELCRRVDRVTLKGSSKPLKLYTYDVPQIASCEGTLADDVNLTDGVSLHDFFNAVAPPYTDTGFRNLWTFAMDLYTGGPTGSTADWVTAKSILLRLLDQLPRDGPALSLLAVMERLRQPDGRAPSNWKGFRSLDEK